jgi:glycosyltransferase involved in cell wall biosynthesis
MGREALSVVLITYNNADTLERCLREVDWADEIVVLDSGSNDDTVAIAQRHGARVAVHPFDDYGPQKQRAFALASHDWILNLDADEILSPGTRAQIERALNAPRYAGYRLPVTAARADVLDGAASLELAQRASAPVRSPPGRHERRGDSCRGGSAWSGADLVARRLRQRRR